MAAMSALSIVVDGAVKEGVLSRETCVDKAPRRVVIRVDGNKEAGFSTHWGCTVTTEKRRESHARPCLSPGSRSRSPVLCGSGA